MCCQNYSQCLQAFILLIVLVFYTTNDTTAELTLNFMTNESSHIEMHNNLELRPKLNDAIQLKAEFTNASHHHRHMTNESSQIEVRNNVDLKPGLNNASQIIIDFKNFDPSKPLGACEKRATCVVPKYTTCLGHQHAYTYVAMDLIPEPMTQDLIYDKLRLLNATRHIPKCWAVLQPLLCSIFMPQCRGGRVELPLQESCKKILHPCRLAMNQTIWPSFINCDNTELFLPKCSDPARHSKFDAPVTGECLRPLVKTDNALAYFDGIDGCGVQCENPFYTSEEHEQIHTFIACGAGISALLNLFTVVTFLIDWRSANKYPAVIIFYINVCFLVTSLQWLAQFSTGNREAIVCKKGEGTPKTDQPTGGDLVCVAHFAITYYFSMAAIAWFVVLTYVWHVNFQALGKMKEKLFKKHTLLHTFSWGCPVMLTVVIIGTTGVDGDSLTGICFVGYTKPMARIVFLLLPLLLAVLVSAYFLTRGLISLTRLKIGSNKVTSLKAGAKIRGTIIRISLFSALMYLTVIITFYCHIYEFLNAAEWQRSFRKYMICSIMTKYAEESDCKFQHRPSVTKMQLHLMAPFLAGIVMSLWAWTNSTVDTWSRFVRRIFRCAHDEPIKLKKHKVIAQAFAKRKDFNDAGRISISFRNTHEDPVGLNFDLSSGASQDFSSTWAAALPKLVTRRGAFFRANSVSSNRRGSVDSEISFSVQRVSVHSRRNSLDSQISVKISEVTATRTVGSSSGPRGKRGKRLRDFGKSRSRKSGPLFRRGSSTSQDSQMANHILAAIAGGDATIAPQMPNMKRRSAVSGTAGRDGLLKHKIIDGKNAAILLPSLFPDHSDSDDNFTSDKEENLRLMTANVAAVEKDEHDSDSEDSQADEDTRMLEPEEPLKHSTSTGKSRKTKFTIENETVLKRLLAESIEGKEKDKKSYKNDDDKNDSASCSSSYSGELFGVMNSDGQNSAREMATQTSAPALAVLELQELQDSINEIVNSRNCSSKGTQISPRLNKSNNRKEARKIERKNNHKNV